MATSSRIEARFQLERVDDQVLLLRCDKSLAVNEEDVLTLIEHQEVLRPGGAAFMLVELNGMVTLSRKAFVLLATALNVAAVAAFGHSAVDHVLVEHFRAVHKPPYPVEYFESHDEALIWLRGTLPDSSPREGMF
ncbi:MAG: hypothetical protein JWM61_2683 [Micrococcaceae bacterium]|nr:hypothetical protein [Micrococcaceae bacterium]